MKASKTLSGPVVAVVAAVVASSVAFGATPASAAQEAYDPTFTPVAADLIGVGSDTTEISMHYVAEGFDGFPGFNDGDAGFRIASFQAGGGGQLTFPQGTTIDRPNGSGAGKSRLYGDNNVAEVDFARSSSALNTNEVNAGLQAFPFAVDGLKLAVSNTVPSHAPATISAADMVKIYDGTVTDWSQLGGTAGTIKPLIPQAGSVTEVQEHDPAPIQGDANAVAPFSTGRAKAAGSAIKLTEGFAANRALYNVVRGADLARADIQAVFGPDGFICSDAAAPLIEGSGFLQLAREANGGACGVATQAATSNFKTNEVSETTTDLTATSPSAGKVTLTATVGSTAGAPTGTVTFTEGEDVVADEVPIVAGQARVTLSAVEAGSHTYTATLNPGEGFLASSDDATVVVSDEVVITAKAKTVKKGKNAKVKVTIAGAEGEVSLLKGTKEIDSSMLKGGKATLVAKKVKKTTKYTVAFGDQTTKVTVKVKKK